MRREWGPWIKSRQWGEFERLAKADPSQPLADTVAELERGFPEKADRRALRKVLFLLSQKGYVPQPIEEPAQEEKPPDALRHFAYMTSPRDDLSQSFALAKTDGRKTVAVYVNVLPGKGVGGAFELEDESDDPEAWLDRTFQRELAMRVGAIAPPPFVRGRVAHELRRTRRVPSAIAFWRSEFEDIDEAPHPAEQMPRSETAPSVWDVVKSSRVLCVWRFELGLASALFAEHSKSEPDAPFHAVLERARHRFFTPEAIDARVLGLLDTAYICHLADRPGSAELLSLADDLRAKGPESEYASRTIEFTFHALGELFEASSKENKG